MIEYIVASILIGLFFIIAWKPIGLMQDKHTRPIGSALLIYIIVSSLIIFKCFLAI